MKALVTGGGGFLGRAIVRQLLDQDWQVRILGRSMHEDLRSQGVEQVSADIRNLDKVLEACKGVDCVFHTAALAGIWGRREDYESINVLGTKHVLKACLEKKVSKLVYTSSPSVVFNGHDQQMLDETTPYPESYLCDYPRTKAIAEKEVLNAHGKELSTVSLRPHLIWGVGDNHLIPRLIERAKSGQLRIVGEGQNEVDMVHVDNAASAHLDAYNALCRGAAGGKAYFITNDEPVQLWKWINELLKAIGVSEVQRKISFKNAWRIGSVMEWIYRLCSIHSEPRMTRFLAAQLSTHHTYSIAAAKRDLGYQIKVKMNEGLEQLLVSIREEED